MLIQETVTDLSPREVVERAKEFFTSRFTPYTAFVREASDQHVRFEFDAGELLIGTGTRDGRTVVRGSTSRIHHELSQFLSTLSAPEDVRQSVLGPGAAGAG